MTEFGKLSREVYREAAELRRIGNRAVHKVQKENRRRGIPNSYSLHGRIHYQLPNGEITEEDPFDEKTGVRQS